MNSPNKSIQVIELNAHSKVYGNRGGWVFTPSDLASLGDPRSVGMALTRMTRKGIIRKLARGLYDYPIKHPTFGLIPPSPDAIAKALVRRDASRIQPAGAYAANILGLSEQVPARVVFLTDGATRKVKFGGQEIVLKRTTPRNMATADRKSGTLIQALRHIGRRNVDERTLGILKRQMASEDREQFAKDLHYAPAWIADIMRKLAS